MTLELDVLIEIAYTNCIFPPRNIRSHRLLSVRNETAVKPNKSRTPLPGRGLNKLAINKDNNNHHPIEPVSHILLISEVYAVDSHVP